MKKTNLIASCPVCGSTAVPTGGFFCARCRSLLEREALDSYMARCPRCHHPLVSSQYHCPHCHGRDDFIPVFSICDYRSPFSRSLFEAMKFGLDKGVFRIAAHIYEVELKKRYAGYVIVPVPCSPQGLKKRGFDQMDRICRLIRTNPVLRVLENTGLREQKKLNKSQRKEASSSRYRMRADLTQKQLDLLRKSRVVLLDDLTTTGASLEACADVLHNAGILHVEALTWFIEM